MRNDSEIVAPFKQEKNDDDGRACLIATARNAMRALGEESVPSEDEIIETVGKDNLFGEGGEIRVAEIYKYLENRGYKVNSRLYGFPGELIEKLLEGTVVIEVVSAQGREGYHAKLLADIRIENGDISLREHDPDPKKPESSLITLDNHIDEVYKKKGLSGLVLVEAKDR